MQGPRNARGRGRRKRKQSSGREEEKERREEGKKEKEKKDGGVKKKKTEKKRKRKAMSAFFNVELTLSLFGALVGQNLKLGIVLRIVQIWDYFCETV